MPLIIDEVIADIEDSVTAPGEQSPVNQAQTQGPEDQQSLLDTLSLAQQRLERLRVD